MTILRRVPGCLQPPAQRRPAREALAATLDEDYRTLIDAVGFAEHEADSR